MDNEKSNQSLINLTFVTIAFLAYYITNVLFETLSGVVGAVARARNQDIFRHGIPVGIGLVVFFVMITNPKLKTWVDDVITEISKVVWPSRKDTVAMTVVCCVMVLIAGIGLGVFDFFASRLITVFIN